MDPFSPLPAVVCLILAIATSSLLVRKFGKPVNHNRYASLDGLRGYLAFFVFLHHSSIWYFYLRSDQWKIPPSNLYTHLGQSSVALFFMITGFLFFSKLLDGRTKEIDWGRLFVSRFMRLVPLYLFVMFLLFSVVIFVSHGILNESPLTLLKGTIKWLGFTALGGPELNGVSHTFTIVAGVTWSLPYEWAFYLSLPLLALTVGVRPPTPYLVLSVITFIGFVLWRQPSAYLLLTFFGGIAAALLVRSVSFKRFATTHLASIISAGCIVTTIAFSPTAYSLLPVLLLSAAFVIIACGNTLFGVLMHPVSHMLGEVAYSIYLLHGLMLFLAFHLILGTADAAVYSSYGHWGVVAVITPLLILGSFVTFRLIESPAMQSTKAVTTWIRYRVISVAGRVEGSR